MLHILLLLLSLSPSSFGGDITLSSASDFISFVDNVNSGTTYSGDTVYLDSDITITGSIDPIGNATSHYFNGTFDGQGHVISNLQINSSSTHTGLFGYSSGLTARNVVLDSSCSITSTFNGSNHVWVGGIIGYCYATNKQCNIESNVNMASVTFNGNTSGYNLRIGGIVGYLSSHKENSAYVKNCVNYGSVTDSGVVSNWTELGGIAGLNCGSSSYYSYIQNCLNYGTITYSGTLTNMSIGGIVGNGYNHTYIENCVSAGKISTQTTASGDNYIGGIVGKVGFNTSINYCYFTSGVNGNSIYGDADSTPSITETPTSLTSVDSELVGKLNRNAKSCNWTNWFILHLNGGNINNLAQESIIGIQGQIPIPVKEGNSFLFWCKDADRTKEFDPETDSVSGIANLYAAWVNNTVTFNVSGGNDLPDYEATKTVTFDKEYGELPKPSRTGYMFVGWFTENNVSVTNETKVTTPYNHTLYARWEEITNWVEIVFTKKDLTKEEVKIIIKKYTTVEFKIIKFENESGELTVIIEFVDKKDAENFIENIKPNGVDNIKEISFIIGSNRSFSLELYPLSFLNAFFL